MNLRSVLACLTLLFPLGCSFSGGPDPLTRKPAIFGLGISVGDIPLEHDVQPRLLVEFGMPVEEGEFGGKRVAHPEFYLPIGSQVTAVSAGSVRDIIELDGPDDVLVMVTPDDAPQWTIGYEHVSNVRVDVGDRVVVGDVIAEISPDDSEFFRGFGKTALMIFVERQGQGNNLTYCPFMLLDASVRQAIYDELETHVQLWEANKGQDIFEEEAWVSPGCYLESFEV